MRIRGVILAATLGLAGCGVQNDRLVCERVCDQQLACNAVQGDAGWQSCYDACKPFSPGEDYAACYESYACDDAYASNVSTYCRLDPLHEALKRSLQDGSH